MNDGNKNQTKKGALQRLEEELYKKNANLFRRGARKQLHMHDVSARSDWDAEQKLPRKPLLTKNKIPLALKIFIASLAFFIVAAGISLFVFFGGANLVSTRNVDISMTGPVSIEAGTEFSFHILIENKNDANLESTDLIIEYPEGAQFQGSSLFGSLRERKSIGTINAHKTYEDDIPLALFGQEGDRKEVKVTLEYRVVGSNAIFVASKNYAVFISSSPITLTVSGKREIVSGQELELEIKVVSNSSDVVKNLLLSVDYPFGFSFTEGAPRPTFGNTVWKLGDINPRAERFIRIRGILEGQDGDEKVFTIKSGTGSASEERAIGILYGSLIESVLIARPSLGVQFFLDGESLSRFVMKMGKESKAQITWINNSPIKITNAQITARLIGDVLDKQSVTTRDGFYNSSDNTITWDKNTKPELGGIEPGARGTIEFTFAPLSAGRQGAPAKNPTINIEISISGEQFGEAGKAGNVQNTISRVASISSDVAIAQRGLYYSGPFTNVGPIPPRVEKETTYTVLWTVINSSNVVRGAVVVATLPSYVRWVDAIYPQGEQVAFNATDRIVSWKLGDVAAGTGIIVAPREAAFQIALLPSLSHLDQTPLLVSGALFEGTDSFTGVRLSAQGRAVDTKLDTDPQFKTGDDKVVP